MNSRTSQYICQPMLMKKTVIYIPKYSNISRTDVHTRARSQADSTCDCKSGPRAAGWRCTRRRPERTPSPRSSRGVLGKAGWTLGSLSKARQNQMSLRRLKADPSITQLIHPCDTPRTVLCPGLANFFHKGPSSKYLRPCEPTPRSQPLSLPP